MGYQQRGQSSRASGRGNAKSPHEKAKTRERKHRSNIRSLPDENSIPTPEEMEERTLTRLRNLGKQKFASSPFREHFTYWQVSLSGVISEFESNPTSHIDDKFVTERSQILSKIKLELEEYGRKETALENVSKNQSNNKLLLERVEEEYIAKGRQLEEQKNRENRHISSLIDELQRELDDIRQIRAGLFRKVSKKTKTQKEAKANQTLNNAKKELEQSVQSFKAEQNTLRNEYEIKKQALLKQIQEQQLEIENIETDGSLEARRSASEALMNAVNALIQRKKASTQET